MIVNFKTVVDEGNTRGLPNSKAILIPNRYDPHRAHVAIYNGAKASEVRVGVAAFPEAGRKIPPDGPEKFYGNPVLEGTCAAGQSASRIIGEFVALILLKS